MISGLSARDFESEMALPDVPVLVAGLGDAVWLSEEGELETISAAEAAWRISSGARPMVAHMRATARRLGMAGFAAHDLLELFAFVLPARFCLPTPRGLARALALPMPTDAVGEALLLQQAARRLLASLKEAAEPGAARLARSMADAGWSWGEAVRAALAAVAPGGAGFSVWQALPLIEEEAPEPAAGHLAVEPEEARRRLAELVGRDAEARPSQADYASAASLAFRPRDRAGEGAFLLAEAGTGVGKTLGYIAPASVWAEKNEGTVWISTYTRNLQQQIVERARSPLSRAGCEGAQSRRAQGPGELSLPAQLRRGDGRFAGGAGGTRERRDPAGAARALDRAHPGRRSQRRRFSRLAARPARPAAQPRPVGPARRMHLFRLPALPLLLHRALGAARAARRDRRRQPCAGDDAGGARRRRRGSERAHPLRVRRGPSSVRCGRQRFFRRISP